MTRPLRLFPAFAAALLTLPPGAEAAPQCRFPAPWTRIEPPARTAAGTPLSPLRIAADPSVLRRGARYEMWFTNADSRQRTGIARAESTDGRIWTVWRSPTNPDPVMDLVLAAPAGGWDAPGLETANVLVGPDGLYRMYYTGNRAPQGSVTFAIGLATSPDGIRWARRNAPVLEAANDWERPICAQPGDPSSCRMGGVLEPSVLHDAAAGLYRMWYVGLGEPSDSFRSFRIGHATSPDGVTWTRRASPVLALGPRGSWDEMWTSHVNVVADPGGGYHMFYFGSAPGDYRDGIEMQRGSIGHAYSADGITWERNPANPILAPRANQVDAWTLGGPTAVVESGRIRLWYFGNRTSGLASDIVMAEAACGP
ncbi:glycoside hydrolase family protein [Neoroseomonas soli]|uniref:Glycosyl hydrolase family 32 N-terminal domain-containing protein n=1 Tax=Neoroseomonas soli TaxID=1081025 RepID=A0A9X9WUW0_9PROT|nr:hypothetical protein [Neoroseomonas soli]MBR0670939.1 hypothetical protein [Neoroseomonas soli]